jgi:hypothetical protein
MSRRVLITALPLNTSTTKKTMVCLQQLDHYSRSTPFPHSLDNSRNPNMVPGILIP